MKESEKAGVHHESIFEQTWTFDDTCRDTCGGFCPTAMGAPCNTI